MPVRTRRSSLPPALLSTRELLAAPKHTVCKVPLNTLSQLRYCAQPLAHGHLSSPMVPRHGSLTLTPGAHLQRADPPPTRLPCSVGASWLLDDSLTRKWPRRVKLIIWVSVSVTIRTQHGDKIISHVSFLALIKIKAHEVMSKITSPCQSQHPGFRIHSCLTFPFSPIRRARARRKAPNAQTS